MVMAAWTLKTFFTVSGQAHRPSLALTLRFIVLNSNPVNVDLHLLRQEVHVLQRITELRRENELSFYRPHSKQEKFHLNDARYRYARTGNRFGKSEMGAAEDVAFAL